VRRCEGVCEWVWVCDDEGGTYFHQRVQKSILLDRWLLTNFLGQLEGSTLRVSKKSGKVSGE